MNLQIVHSGKSTPQFVQTLSKQLGALPFKVLPTPPPPESVSATDLLFVLGGVSVDTLRTLGLVNKSHKLTTLREKVFKYGEGRGLVSFSPNALFSNPELEGALNWDFEMIRRLATTGTAAPDMSDVVYRYVPNFNDVFHHVRSHYKSSGRAVPLSLDLETIGKDPFALPTEDHPGAAIVSVSVTHTEGQADVWYCEEHVGVWGQVHRLCTSEKIKMIGANLKYDAVWLLEKAGIEITNQAFDTFLVGSLMNENEKNSLNVHAKEYTHIGGYDDEFNATQDKSRMDLIPKEDLLPYAGGDTDACLRVYHQMRPKLINQQRLANFYVELLQPSVNAFTMMEHRGVVVDRDKYAEMQADMQAVIKNIGAQALKMVPATIKHQLTDKQKSNLGNAKLLSRFLFSKHGLNLKPKLRTEKTNAPSTAADHLMMFADHPEAGPFIKLLIEYNATAKALSTYVTGFLKHLRDDGKFHPVYWLGHSDFGGTVTGRLSARDPAWQTLPKHTKNANLLREAFVPPKGHVILKLDFSQGELRVTACVANEPTMIQAYKNGIDLHLKTGARVNGISLEDALKLPEKQMKIIRQGGKAGNFGLIYKMQPEGFMHYARDEYGVDLTSEEANEFHEAFFNTYPGLNEWHDTYQRMARTHGFVMSPLGRIRHLPNIHSKSMGLRSKAERQAVNSPIQSTLSDMAQLALAILHQRYPDLWAFGTTHDEIQFYVPEEKLYFWADRISEVMEDLPFEKFGWSPQLTFPVDAEWSADNLGACVPLAA